jgi:(1->4)-alpha-D-glucan 1-alpha-D-glucosylmutase
VSVPRATMRLQFHRGFTFNDAIEIVPYIDRLNVSHLYASPILKARAGSMHGYDVVDPTLINPELGGEEAFRAFVGELRTRGLGIIVDIVPNHMAAGGDDNVWWLDVLQRGRQSAYAKFFDIDWNAPAVSGKLLVPFLGGPYADILASGDLKLVQNDHADRYELAYFQHRFPIRPQDRDEIADQSLTHFDGRTEPGRQRLRQLLEKQNYHLAWWKLANDTINWRRFFDINELAALRQEDDEVFAVTHQKILQLYAEGLIDGLRIDHVDGLSDPRAYCLKLRSRLEELSSQRPPELRGRPYIVVEKIFGAGEALPIDWRVDGTTGYDFMDQVSRVLHDRRGAMPLQQLWHKVSGRPEAFEEEEDIARRAILGRSFAAQLESVVEIVCAICGADPISYDVSRPSVRRVLVELLAHMRVYRTYARVGEASNVDNFHLDAAVIGASHSCLPSDRGMLNRVAAWVDGVSNTQEDAELRAEAIRKFQQLTAPLAAKAVEDTAFYRYGALLSRLDVGFHASSFGGDIQAFHEEMETRARTFPHSMLATATHDHKRGEDVRARLAVLSEMPDEWDAILGTWLDDAAPFLSTIEGKTAPSPGDATLLFQMIVAAWPLDLSHDDAQGCVAFAERLATWQMKALREAKLETDWSAPNVPYESAAKDFLTKLFEDDWLRKISAFVDKIAAAGAVNGLGQALLKLTVPGVPDLYQGTEFWDFSFVDPDNRRPVDFGARIRSLDEDVPWSTLVENWRDGRIKQTMIARTLAARRRWPELFEKGLYLPIDTRGPASAHLVAFARVHAGRVALVLCPRLSSGRFDGGLVARPRRWAGTELHLPQEFPLSRLRDAFTGATASVDGWVLEVAALLGHTPVALLFSEP